ncbi:MAG: peptidoglycan-binding protein [Candidatus Falkowbacteria bacterium]|nr:peptidoglycan-binding protein [Candidatus Falkowbacteria bacterium]
MSKTNRKLLFFALAIVGFSIFPLCSQAALSFRSLGGPWLMSEAIDTDIVVASGTPYTAFIDLADVGDPTLMKYDGSSWVKASNISDSGSQNVQIKNFGSIIYLAYENTPEAATNPLAKIWRYENNTWQDISPASGAETLNYYSLALAVNNNGQPYLAFSDSSQGNAVKVMQYTNGNWVNAGVGNLGTNSNYQKLSLTFDNTNTPYLASQTYVKNLVNGTWGSVGTKTGNIEIKANGNTVFVSGTKSVSKWNGTTWENLDAAHLSGITLGSGNITMEVFNNKPFISFVDGSRANRVTVMEYENNLWQVVDRAGFSQAEDSENVSLFIDDGVPMVSFIDGHQAPVSVMKYSYQYNGEMTAVGAPRFSEDNYLTLNPDFFVASGTPYVVYESLDIEANSRLIARKYENSNWQNIGTPINNNDLGNNPKIFVENGTPYVFFRNNDQAELAKYNSASSTWETVGITNFTGGAINSTGLIVKNGTPYVLFSNNLGFVKVMRFNGTHWELVGASLNSANAQDLSLKLSDGEIYAGFREGTTGKIFKLTGNSWVSVGNIGASVDSNFNFNVFASTTYAVFDQTINGKSALKAFRNKRYVGNPGYFAAIGGGVSSVSYGPAVSPSISFSNSGIPFVSYIDTDLNNKVIIRKYDASIDPYWQTVADENFSPADSGHPIIFIEDNQLYESYQENDLTGSGDIAGPLTVKKFQETPISTTIQYYSDQALSSPVADNHIADAGEVYYQKISSSENGVPLATISIDAEGINNDISDQPLEKINSEKPKNNSFVLRRQIRSDHLALASQPEDINISFKDDFGENVPVQINNKIAKALLISNTNGDNTPPAINLNGANPLNIYLDEDYLEPGIGVIDNVDGDISNRATSTNNIQRGRLGSYSVNYRARDNANNDGQNIRTVNIVSRPSGGFFSAVPVKHFSSINSPLVLKYGQSGDLSTQKIRDKQTFKIETVVPEQRTASSTTYLGEISQSTSSLGFIYSIKALNDQQKNISKFDQNLTIKIFSPEIKEGSKLGLYSYNQDDKKWQKLKDYTFNYQEQSASTILDKPAELSLITDNNQANMAPPVNTGNSESVTKIALIKNSLQYGNRTPEVKKLQQFLIQNKTLAPKLATGFYGQLTTNAVKKFQTSYKLPATGKVDTKTKNKINELN